MFGRRAQSVQIGDLDPLIGVDDAFCPKRSRDRANGLFRDGFQAGRIFPPSTFNFSNAISPEVMSMSRDFIRSAFCCRSGAVPPEQYLCVICPGEAREIFVGGGRSMAVDICRPVPGVRCRDTCR